MIEIEKEEKEPSKLYRIEVSGVMRILPIRRVSPTVQVALLNILGDWELTEAIGESLALMIPKGVQMLVMPDGKAQALLHVMGRESMLPTIVARKERKPYMAEPICSVESVQSITTAKRQGLYLGNDDVLSLQGQKVAIVDDVVSSGGTIDAMKQLMQKAGAEVVAIMAGFTEGAPKPEVIALGHIPLF